MFRYFDIFTLFGKKQYTMFKIYNDGTTEPQNVKKNLTVF